MNSEESLQRNERIAKKTRERAASEVSKTLGLLRSRPDYSDGYEYFLKLAEEGASGEAVSERVGRPILKLLCIQAPVELIHAAGFHPLKIWSGSASLGNFAAQGTPALMCPMLRAVLGALRSENDGSEGRWILPTTCDWVVKFPEMASWFGPSFASRVHWLELPHIKEGDDGQKRWLEEVFRLKKFLEGAARNGKKIDRKSLIRSVELYQDAWRALNRLAVLRRDGKLASLWFMLIAGTFFLDSAESWIAAADRVLGAPSPDRAGRARVFLAGSPIFFPNFKLPLLLEEAGLAVAGDDLCSSERILPGAVTYGDASEFGLMSALAQRYHMGCLCPTFIDNDRRINNIRGRLNGDDFGGVVFHVLKGCHPYDIESCGLEGSLKEHGLKFIRLETDYASEDSSNLLTRAEAFRNTMRSDGNDG
ncbi:3-hydroxyacyl-ACP dehydratase [Synergistales bacterium]|nr:3-hydroxyacyl-ACP dehydratase [Synergistales bacterium]